MWKVGKRDAVRPRWLSNGVTLRPTDGDAFVHFWRESPTGIVYLQADLSTWDAAFYEHEITDFNVQDDRYEFPFTPTATWAPWGVTATARHTAHPRRISWRRYVTVRDLDDDTTGAAGTGGARYE